MRRFQLIRTTDLTGVSGTGVVAEGCQYSDGTASVHWLGERSSTVAWSRIEDAYHVHGHAASTQFRWLDDEADAVAALDPTEVWVVPKVPFDPGFVSGARVLVMSCMDGDDMDAAEAREFAADYLAAADEAERVEREARRG